MDLVSIIIPYYKKKNFIIDSINSAISQSYKEIEILIVYDDENHEDLQFLKKIKSKDERIKIIINKKKNGSWNFKKYRHIQFKRQLYSFFRCR